MLTPTETPIDLNKRRAEKKAEDCVATPIECVRELLRDMEEGAIQPNQIAIHLVRVNDGGDVLHHFRSSGLSVMEHVAILEFAKFRLIGESAK